MLLTSPDFEHDKPIPIKFTCDGADSNPALTIGNVPADAKSLALIMDDPDAPNGTFTHWTVWNISSRIGYIKEGDKPPGSVEGVTDFGRTGYGGPCPPRGTHRYFFKLYALDAMLDLPEGANRATLEEEIQKHLIARAELMGLYERE